ncbi:MULTISPECIES: leucine efflux protein LeuE [unclassified Herbaspirillum]|uniref:leucine efflux protein LeuE n=1 Tax=unclassified Herbaspirillum TaxID=2624150 RepID=UPI00114DBF8F|nr:MULTISPECIES: leucine efflux protein LeuE [unclassified Herbaspirillum]MBB5393949.1 threonine/homoserine/homoserine lactone efflux protein [Herbaspirillum sp. SJZ102]TQK00015.1 threonine/homoserine/homoserine lactone efflux protein [Herbaspirillum sp. SJZ130]TQK04661.1 threonine/homoserine/homoserine lactone efflux protein [Herbaspirillum sp. SJZ106]TWC63222.1 threonine/homoserine/homoserine lactone efflux protein [Herbaspirillum sp. SJZ099]
MQALFHSIGITDIWQLVAATMVFLLLPGPGTFCVLTCSAKHGLRGGFAAMAGLMLGDIVLMFLAAIGVAALLHANPLLFRGMQYLGAAYLAYLGLRLLFARGEGGGTVVPFSNAADFRRGFLVTLINPKAIVFYMAFFPLFLDPATQQGALTFVTMGAVICCCTAFYGSILVLAGNAAARRLARNRTIATLASRAAGVFLIGFGIKLTTQ